MAYRPKLEDVKSLTAIPIPFRPSSQLPKRRSCSCLKPGLNNFMRLVVKIPTIGVYVVQEPTIQNIVIKMRN